MLYKTRTVTLQINEKLLTEFPLEIGVSEDCPISPYLFNIALIPLIKARKMQGIHHENCNLKAMSFIDHILWLLGPK